MPPSDDPLDAVLRPPPDETEEQAVIRLEREDLARKVSAKIDADIRAERQARKKKRIVRLLLLGQSESGKSTTLRQFQRLYTPTAFRAERVHWRAVIQLNIVRSIHTILEALAESSAIPIPGRARGRRRSTSLHAFASSSPGAGPSTIPLSISPDVAPSYYDGGGGEFAFNGVDSDPDSDPESAYERFAIHPPQQTAAAYDGYSMRLLPLRHVEALLIARLVPAHEDEPTHLPGRGPDSISSNSSGEIFVRPGNRWKGARRRSPDPVPRDEVQDTLHSCSQVMQGLWLDTDVRNVLKRRKIRLEEGPGFFLNDLARVTAPNYLPTDDDVLRARLKTVGVSEYTFEMEVPTGRETGAEWRIVDVGGSRSQRATWVPFFDDVDAIIFLAPISGFDQVLSEDRTVNRLEDSVLLWKALCGNKLLAAVDIVLFLNKCDILEAKLKAGIRLAKYVKSYADRENTVDAVSSYLRSKFSAIHRESSPSPRKFYAFCTSVTDTATTGGIIASVRDMVVRQHLKQSKLL
ncbi:unnamed protein product [Mycena citricolor]|uniref:G-alpha-domain-containing protein n=1 Tax=Mycena citricolor TaxID=2018698 RepID=A0AAD2HBJ9_9AGAR|nr:unnamed protein product [Mycena citricolor]